MQMRKKALGYLRTIGYYRLSGYLYPFRQFNPKNPKNRLDSFIPNSSFEDVKKLYMLISGCGNWHWML